MQCIGKSAALHRGNRGKNAAVEAWAAKDIDHALQSIGEKKAASSVGMCKLDVMIFQSEDANVGYSSVRSTDEDTCSA